MQQNSLKLSEHPLGSLSDLVASAWKRWGCRRASLPRELGGRLTKWVWEQTSAEGLHLPKFVGCLSLQSGTVHDPLVLTVCGPGGPDLLSSSQQTPQKARLCRQSAGVGSSSVASAAAGCSSVTQAFLLPRKKVHQILGVAE